MRYWLPCAPHRTNSIYRSHHPCHTLAPMIRWIEHLFPVAVLVVGIISGASAMLLWLLYTLIVASVGLSLADWWLDRKA